MRIFAYCDQSFEKSMRWVAGVQPVTCPPVTAETFDLAWLENQDLILIDLHGEQGLDYWYAVIDEPGGIAQRIAALRAEQIRQANLGGSVIFATSCYLGEEGNPMLEALLDAGASIVIAGAGKNYAGERKMAGAGLLGLFFRMFLETGVSPLKALATAKHSLRLVARNRRAREDALAFQAFERSIT
jgi:hypothetical protein